MSENNKDKKQPWYLNEESKSHMLKRLNISGLPLEIMTKRMLEEKGFETDQFIYQFIDEKTKKEVEREVDFIAKKHFDEEGDYIDFRCTLVLLGDCKTISFSDIFFFPDDPIHLIRSESYSNDLPLVIGLTKRIFSHIYLDKSNFSQNFPIISRNLAELNVPQKKVEGKSKRAPKREKRILKGHEQVYSCIRSYIADIYQHIDKIHLLSGRRRKKDESIALEIDLEEFLHSKMVKELLPLYKTYLKEKFDPLEKLIVDKGINFAFSSSTKSFIQETTDTIKESIQETKILVSFFLIFPFVVTTADVFEVKTDSQTFRADSFEKIDYGVFLHHRYRLKDYYKERAEIDSWGYVPIIVCNIHQFQNCFAAIEEKTRVFFKELIDFDNKNRIKVWVNHLMEEESFNTFKATFSLA